MVRLTERVSLSLRVCSISSGAEPHSYHFIKHEAFSSTCQSCQCPRFKQDLCLLFCIFFIKLTLTLQTCISGPCFPLLLVHSLSFFATKQQPPFTQPAKLPALFLIPGESINAVLSKLLACLCYAAVSGALGHHSPFIWVFFSHKRLPRFTALDT